VDIDSDAMKVALIGGEAMIVLLIDGAAGANAKCSGRQLTDRSYIM
jgi:hypothetical protein